jgi:Txe/YoeB family toxin of Txe-Axe toxin-antitoxin module
MKILPLYREVIAYLGERNLIKKFEKQCALFQKNPFHPSLETELLEPRNLKIWSFRVDRKYRAIFIFREKDAIEILDVNNHYQ